MPNLPPLVPPPTFLPLPPSSAVAFATRRSESCASRALRNGSSRASEPSGGEGACRTCSSRLRRASVKERLRGLRVPRSYHTSQWEVVGSTTALIESRMSACTLALSNFLLVRRKGSCTLILRSALDSEDSPFACKLCCADRAPEYASELQTKQTAPRLERDGRRKLLSASLCTSTVIPRDQDCPPTSNYTKQLTELPRSIPCASKPSPCADPSSPIICLL